VLSIDSAEGNALVCLFCRLASVCFVSFVYLGSRCSAAAARDCPKETRLCVNEKAPKGINAQQETQLSGPATQKCEEEEAEATKTLAIYFRIS